jgi:membrane dipeptidase
VTLLKTPTMGRAVVPMIFPILLMGGSACSDAPERGSESELQRKAREIHDRVVTLDTHVDIPVTFMTPLNPKRGNEAKLMSWQQMVDGGMDGSVFAVFDDNRARTPEDYKASYDDVVDQIETIRRVALDEMPDRIGLALHPEDVPRIMAEGKRFAVIGIENGYPVGEDLANIQRFYDFGARYITLTHIEHNQLSDSTTLEHDAEPEHDGLSQLGIEAVAEMNRLGMIVDVTHVSKKAMLDALRHSKAPVLASHSCVRAVSDHARNMDDEQLLALKKNGGVISLVGLSLFVKEDGPEREAALQRLRESYGFPSELFEFLGAYYRKEPSIQEAYTENMASIDAEYPPASVSDLIDHVDHVVDLIGIDHVAFSADFFLKAFTINGWESAGMAPNLTLELVRRGYSEEDIGKIWSGNFFRVWREVERVAGDPRGRY